MPTVILAHTVKGRGISFTEGRSEWHARPATADEAAAARARAAPRGGADAVSKPQRDVWAETLVELAATNPDILVLDADLATSTKADKFAAAYPDRFLQMGIAEQSMVGRGGRARRSPGFVPWLSSFGIFFSNRALDQVRMSVAQTHANVKIGAAYTGLMAGLAGKTHVDISDLATCGRCPGMTILCPADAAETAAMTRWATATPGPSTCAWAARPGRTCSGRTTSSSPGA